MGSLSEHARWMGAALALGARGRGRTSPNPNVGCVIVKQGRVVGRGWTQQGGRPHAEAMALAEAGDAARGSTVYVTLEPCAHESARGPACADSLIAAGVARVVAAVRDPDTRTSGRGYDRLRGAGIEIVEGVRESEALRSLAGFVTRQRLGRPFVTLKLATSLDGRIAMADGRSRWITGDAARAHVHLERSRHDAILVGRGTWEADAPALDVRLEGLEDRSPVRVILTSKSSMPSPSTPPIGVAQDELQPLAEVEARTSLESGDQVGASLDFARDGRDIILAESPRDIAALPIDHLLIEGGASGAAAFLRADMVDRLLLYRAPILIGDGRAAIGDIGLTDLSDAHGRWQLMDARMLGSDRLEDYERRR